MKKYIIMLSFLIITNLAYSQNYPKYDNVWIMGRKQNMSNPLLGNFEMNFGNGTINISAIQRDFSIHVTNAAMSDSLGNLLFYTNGIDIRNKNDSIMENGDTLIACQAVIDYWNGLPYDQGVMAIPRPNYPNQYWLFVSIFDNYPDIDRPLNLYANLIDMSYNNGLGKVVEKSRVILTDTLTEGGLNAVKHANGRDWWIVSVQARSDSTNCYHLHLLTPDTIIYKGLQCIGQKRIEDALSVFSPDGNFFVVSNASNEVEILTFDRCRGILKHQESILYTTFNPGTGTASISPNSQYLYVNNTVAGQLYQYDLAATNIGASGQLVWEHIAGQSYAFHYMALAPDGKIYSPTSINGTGALDVIHNPNLQGANCNISIAGIATPRLVNLGFPHFPHYRLGAEVGSDCDTLGTVSVIQPQEREKIKVYPNPTSGNIEIVLPEKGLYELQLWDYTGRKIYTYSFYADNLKEKCNFSNLISGLYHCIILSNNNIQHQQTITIIK